VNDWLQAFLFAIVGWQLRCLGHDLPQVEQVVSLFAACFQPETRDTCAYDGWWDLASQCV